MIMEDKIPVGPLTGYCIPPDEHRSLPRGAASELRANPDGQAVAGEQLAQRSTAVTVSYLAGIGGAAGARERCRLAANAALSLIVPARLLCPSGLRAGAQMLHHFLIAAVEPVYGG